MGKVEKEATLYNTEKICNHLCIRNEFEKKENFKICFELILGYLKNTRHSKDIVSAFVQSKSAPRSDS